MISLEKCDKIQNEQGAIYLGPSTKEYSEGYLELNPHSSLTLHNRIGGIENLKQVEGKCVMIIFNNDKGTNHLLKVNDSLKIEPEGVWHIHSNPFKEKSQTYWKFDGDIRHVIQKIRNGKH